MAKKELDIVGTAEAAAILGVERPRIGRWMRKGMMPAPARVLKATPVWHTKDIEAMKDWVEAHRRKHPEPFVAVAPIEPDEPFDEEAYEAMIAAMEAMIERSPRLMDVLIKRSAQAKDGGGS